jgi:hypothetical protein
MNSIHRTEPNSYGASQGSSVSIVTEVRVGGPGFGSRQGQRTFFFVTVAAPSQGLPSLLQNGYSGALFLRLKRLVREADHHLAPKFRIHGAILPLPNTSSLRCV